MNVLLREREKISVYYANLVAKKVCKNQLDEKQIYLEMYQFKVNIMK